MLTAGGAVDRGEFVPLSLYFCTNRYGTISHRQPRCTPLPALIIHLIGEFLSVSRRRPGNKNAPKIRGK
uniref:Uncharacterized protein n=1 Tax=Microviridae sp. ctoGr7 TaxID=2827649 RepID=A0A8S5SXJ4_9VIRU|nr:MAG TPA: hypothetical protein [Microviridae sp. ctoGr7]